MNTRAVCFNGQNQLECKGTKHNKSPRHFWWDVPSAQGGDHKALFFVTHDRAHILVHWVYSFHFVSFNCTVLTKDSEEAVSVSDESKETPGSESKSPESTTPGDAKAEEDSGPEGKGAQREPGATRCFKGSPQKSVQNGSMVWSRRQTVGIQAHTKLWNSFMWPLAPNTVGMVASESHWNSSCWLPVLFLVETFVDPVLLSLFAMWMTIEPSPFSSCWSLVVNGVNFFSSHYANGEMLGLVKDRTVIGSRSERIVLMRNALCRLKRYKSQEFLLGMRHCSNALFHWNLCKVVLQLTIQSN